MLSLAADPWPFLRLAEHHMIHQTEPGSAAPESRSRGRRFSSRSPSWSLTDLRPLHVLLIAWFFAFLVAAAWSLSSPVSSGPDESGHIMKAAASVRGMWTGAPTPHLGDSLFRLPANIGDVGGALTCYVGRPDITAACSPTLDSLGSKVVDVTSGAASYNPLYYLIVGWPSLIISGEASVMAMRLMSGLLNSFFVGLLFYVAFQLPRARSLPAWIAIALTPMAVYLTGVLNPNGVEITASAALTALALLVIHDRSHTSLPSRMALLAVSGIVAGNARATSPLSVAIIVIAVALTVPPPRLLSLIKRRAVWIAATASALGLLFAVVWTEFIGGPGGFIPSGDPARPGPIVAFVKTLADTSSYGRQMVGVLGWFEVSLPDVIYLGWTAAIGFVVVAGLAAGRKRMVIGAVVLMAATVFIPALIQAPFASTFGYIWQGRYLLPLFVAMVLVTGFVIDRFVLRPQSSVPLVAVIASLAGIAQIVAFGSAYHLYSVGLNGSWRRMFGNAPWHAPGGIATSLSLFCIGTIGIVVLSIWLSRRAAPNPDSLDDSQRSSIYRRNSFQP